MQVNWKRAQRKAAITARWAVTMTKWHIRHVAAKTRWELVTFCGPAGGESVGVVDLLAIRKDHHTSMAGMKRGDGLQVIIIQVKGGCAAKPTKEDCQRLRAVSRHHRALGVLLATWKKGTPVRFFQLRNKTDIALRDWKRYWIEVTDLDTVFR